MVVAKWILSKYQTYHMHFKFPYIILNMWTVSMWDDFLVYEHRVVATRELIFDNSGFSLDSIYNFDSFDGWIIVNKFPMFNSISGKTTTYVTLHDFYHQEVNTIWCWRANINLVEMLYIGWKNLLKIYFCNIRVSLHYHALFFTLVVCKNCDSKMWKFKP